MDTIKNKGRYILMYHKNDELLKQLNIQNIIKLGVSQTIQIPQYITQLL